MPRRAILTVNTSPLQTFMLQRSNQGPNAPKKAVVSAAFGQYLTVVRLTTRTWEVPSCESPAV